MKNKSITIQDRICCLLAMAIIASLWGCAKMPIKHPEPPVPGEEMPVPEKPAPEKPAKTFTLTRILMAEAEKFSAQNNNQDALFVYNQALALSEPMEESTGMEETIDRQEILSGIEKVLAKTDPHVIEEFIQIKNLSIPRSLLLYWLGLNHAAKNNYSEAVKELVAFIDTYPDHAYAQDAQDLLAAMKLATFKTDTIGCLLPLSGKYRAFGQRALQGIQLAVQDLSKRYDQNFYVIIKDTQSNPERAAQCVDELNREKVVGILGPMLTTQTAGIRAEKLGIPLIALTQKSDFPLQGDYLFSNFITPEMQVRSLASYIFMELGLKKVAILYPNERYGKRYMKLFWDVVEEFKGEVVGVESYDGKNTDFAAPIQKLTGEFYPIPEFLIPEMPVESEAVTGENDFGILDLSREAPVDPEANERLQPPSRGAVTPGEDRIEIDFQALFIPDSVSRINLILPQLAFNDATGMVLLGTNLWHQESLLTGAKGYNKNAVISDGYLGNSKNPITAGFEKRFQELYESQPGFLEAVAYDTANILFIAAMDEGVDSREGVKNALQESFFEGVTGNTIFDKTGSAHKKLFLITVKKNKFMEIGH